MPTLTPTLTLKSTDVTSDEVNFSVSDSLSISGDVVSLSRVALSTSDLTLFASSAYSRSYVYLKNTDSSIAMDIDFGTTASFNLRPGEFAFFPWHGGSNILALADSGTPVLEYALWEA
jgi:hypothetical protein